MLVASRITTDHASTTKTVGSIECVVDDQGHDLICLAYRCTGYVQCLSQSSNVHAFVFDLSTDIKLQGVVNFV